MSRQIVVAVDLEAHFATSLVTYAQQFANTMGDTLNVLYVIEPKGTGGFFSFKNSTKVEAKTEDELAVLSQEYLAQLNNALPIPLEKEQLHIREGNIAETINADIEELQAELLVIGAESRTSLQQLLDRKGTSQLTRLADCNVLVVGKEHLGLA